MHRWLRAVAALLLLGAPAPEWTSAQTGPTPASSVSVLRYGAVGDGATDCTGAFQQALDEMGKQGGGIVEAPAGKYAMRGTLSVPANVTLQGVYRVPPTVSKADVQTLTGSVLLAYAGRGKPDSAPFIRLAGSCSSVAGFVVFYPEWKQQDVPPVPYPPCIASEGTENVGIRDCCLVNPYEGIRLVLAHRHIVRNVTGYPIARGIFVDQCYDIGHIENIHFWPFGVLYSPDDPYCKWVNTKGVAFELGRTDWHYIHNTFCFGYGVGYKFSEYKSGPTNGNFLGLGADSCRRAVLVESAQDPGLLITNGEFVGRWSSTDSVCLEIGPKARGKVSLVNCSFWGPIDRCVLLRSKDAQFTASACNFVNWDVNQHGAPAIDLPQGSAILQGCTFLQAGLNVRVGAAAQSVLITGNQAPEGLNVENHAGFRTVMSANSADTLRWTPEALRNYDVAIGTPGDGRYVKFWHGREALTIHGKALTQRWSMPRSVLKLPVTPGAAVQLRVHADVPVHAAGPGSGIYLGKQKLIAFDKPGARLWSAAFMPTAAVVALELRCTGWEPRKVIKGSSDPRVLGVAVYGVQVRAAKGSGARTFDANTGNWKQARKGTRP